MADWKEYKLGDIATVVDCEHKTAPIVDTGEYISVRTTDISNGKIDYQKANRVSFETYTKWTKRLVPREGDIILAREAPVGEVGWITNNRKVCLGQRTVLLRLHNENIYPQYLLYYLANPATKYELINRSTGSVVEHLNVKDIRGFELKIPSDLLEQQAIAEVLSSLDAKIDLLHRQNKTLEAMAETLFRQWFVEEAEESWEIGTIEDEFIFTMGQSPLGASLNEYGNGMIFFQGRTDFNFRFPEQRIYTTEPNRLAKKFDTLVSVRAPVGDMNMAIEDCCLGRGVAAFRYKLDSNFNTYTYYKLRSLMAQIKQFEDNGTVFGSIGKDDFKKLENVIPPKDLIQKFQSKASELDEKIYQNTVQISLLTKLRDELLPKLMRGDEVRVKIAEAETAAVNQ